MNKETRLHVGYAPAAVFGVLLLHSVITAAVSVTAIPYSEFRQYLREGKVADVNVSDRYVDGTLKEKLPNGSAKFSTTRVDPDLANELQQYGVKFNGVVESNVLGSLLGWLMPVLLFVGVWWFVMRRFAANQGFGGGLMQLGKSKARIYVASRRFLFRLRQGRCGRRVRTQRELPSRNPDRSCGRRRGYEFGLRLGHRGRRPTCCLRRGSSEGDRTRHHDGWSVYRPRSRYRW